MTTVVWELLDRLAYPVPLLLVCLALLFSTHRLRQLGERAAGVLGGALLLAFGVFCVMEEAGREFFFTPQRLPVTLCFLATPVVAWVSRQRSRQGDTLLDIDTESLISGSAKDSPWAELAVALGTVLLVIFLALTVDTPLGPSASTSLEPSLEPQHLPWFLAGWQEMRTVLRPAVGWLLWPLLFGALWTLPYLDVASDDEAGGSRRESVRLFLFFALTLGSVPVAVAMFLRTPGWQSSGLLGPRETIVESMSLAERVWVGTLNMAPPQVWIFREMPGLLAIALYLGVLWWALPKWRASRGLFQRYRRALGDMRYRIALGLFAALGWVPLKLLAYWLLAVDDWVVLPMWPGGL